MTCENCFQWVRERRRLYGDGTEQTYYVAPEGKGNCAYLNIDTPPEFSCAAFIEGGLSVHVDVVEGAPWQYFHMGACPDCNGTGGGGTCRRCTGIGLVRFYADGYVGEERTRRHPKEPLPEPTQSQILVAQPAPNVIGVNA